MEQQGKLEVLRYLSELAIKEADLIWLRYQTMLIASTGLIAILGYSIDKHIIWVSLYRLNSWCRLGFGVATDPQAFTVLLPEMAT